MTRQNCFRTECAGQFYLYLLELNTPVGIPIDSTTILVPPQILDLVRYETGVHMT
jgi:hypothetical protein